jgi:regulator of chromosome condensation
MFLGGEHHTLILDNNYKIFSFGRTHYGRLGTGFYQQNIDHYAQPKEIEFLRHRSIRDIICGSQNSFAISKEGNLYSWGFGSTLQLGLGHEEDVSHPSIVELTQNNKKKYFNILKMSSNAQHTLIIACERRRNKRNQLI